MDYDELRLSALTWLKGNRGKPPPRELTLHVLEVDGDPVMLRLLVRSLWRDGLIDGIPAYHKDGGDLMNPVIKEAGILALNGPPPPVQQTFNVEGISGGTVQFGNGNAQHVNVHLQVIVETIQAAKLPPAAEKRVFSKLHAFLSDPAVSNVIQGASVVAQALDSKT